MRTIALVLAILSIPAISQNLVLVNAGVSSGSITNKSTGSQVVVGSIGSPTSINVLRTDKQVIHHGVDHPLVMKVKKTDLSIGVYPNPTYGPVTIAIAGELTGTPEQLLVIDPTGKVVIAQKNTESVNLENLSAGTYLIQLVAKDQTYQSQPIVLSK
jgi:hypothetical protein